jgi:hypothetical protein
MEMDMQGYIDALSDGWKKDRSKYHLTLGALHAALQEANPDALVLLDGGETSPDEPHSYRGYYSDLAFERVQPLRKVSQLLVEVADALGATFEGYKGGDFTMDSETPLWVSSYGSSSGIAMMAVTTLPDGNLSIVTKKID